MAKKIPDSKKPNDLQQRPDERDSEAHSYLGYGFGTRPKSQSDNKR